MLILTRRIGETLKIGDDVSLMVLGVQGNQVRIGADAPKDVAIHREEIYRRIQQEKMNGGQTAPPAAKTQHKSSYNNAPSRNNSQHHNSNNHSSNSHGSNNHGSNNYGSNSYNSSNNYNSRGSNYARNGQPGNSIYDGNGNGNSDRSFKKRDDYKKPFTPRRDYGNQQENSAENARFYSTEGSNGNKAQKKAPNVIVKKKRVIEDS